MTTAADFLRMIAKAQLTSYIESALEFLRSEDSSEIKRWVQDTGLAKIELALVEAYMEFLNERRAKLVSEVKRYRKRFR